MTLGDKLKDLRIKKSLLQRDVAEGVGISIVMVSQYESGKKKPSRETAIKLADFYNVDISYLLTDATSTLTKRDQKDVAKTLEKVMLDLQDGENSPLFYGDKMSDSDIEILKSTLGNALEIIKLKNKDKYSPKKYR